MNPVMYLILNKSLGMSTGKAAAQTGHAAVEAYRLSMSTDPDQHIPPFAHQNSAVLYERNAVRLWYKGGHYTKIVLEAEGDLKAVSEYLGARSFAHALIVDEGRTEVDPFTPTAIGCAIVDKDSPHVQATFGTFNLYREPLTISMEEHVKALCLSKYAYIRQLARRGEIGRARDATAWRADNEGEPLPAAKAEKAHNRFTRWLDGI